MYSLILKENEIETFYKKEDKFNMIALCGFAATTSIPICLNLYFTVTNPLLSFSSVGIAAISLILLIIHCSGKTTIIKDIFFYRKKKYLKEKCVNDLNAISKIIDKEDNWDSLLLLLKKSIEIQNFVRKDSDILALSNDITLQIVEKIAATPRFKSYALLKFSSYIFKEDDKRVLEKMFDFIKKEEEDFYIKTNIDLSKECCDNNIGENFIFGRKFRLQLGSYVYTDLKNGIYGRIQEGGIVNLLFYLFFKDSVDDIFQIEYNVKNIIPILKEREKYIENQILEDIKNGKITKNKDSEYENYLEKLLKI